MNTKMKKTRTVYLWAVADHDFAGNLISSLLFRTRERARSMAYVMNGGGRVKRFYPVKAEVNYQIHERDRW